MAACPREHNASVEAVRIDLGWDRVGRGVVAAREVWRVRVLAGRRVSGLEAKLPVVVVSRREQPLVHRHKQRVRVPCPRHTDVSGLDGRLSCGDRDGQRSVERRTSFLGIASAHEHRPEQVHEQHEHEQEHVSSMNTISISISITTIFLSASRMRMSMSMSMSTC
eukprot:3941827-Rhodomonas_salina.2